MIDESLPSKEHTRLSDPSALGISSNHPSAFFFKNNSKQPQLSTVYHRQHGNDPEPAYSLRALDPTSPTSQNRYGVALYDPYVTDVVYGEVAVVPEWTQPSLSAETIRANGGSAPPAEPILPNEFTIQLYNPDQTITVKYHTKSWNKPARWEFEMTQNTFRVPSGSTLDQGQIDPSINDMTPKLRFSWRKDGKLSKDLTCLLHGKTSAISDTRTKSREPDITVALFQGLKELTLYQPNLQRVEMEDFKGLEVVLLLATIAIRDIFFGPAKEAFHISNNPTQLKRKPTAVPVTVPTATPGADTRIDRQNSHPVAGPPGAAMNSNASSRHNIPSSTSPGPQDRKRQDELAKKEEERRKQEIFNAEQARRRRDADIEKETKRLRKVYGKEEEQALRQRRTSAPESRPSLPPRPHGAPQLYSHQPSQYSIPAPPPHGRPHPHGPVQFSNPHHAGQIDPRAQHTQFMRPQYRPQLQPRPQSVAVYPPITSSGALPAPSKPGQLQSKRSSFFGFRRTKDERTKEEDQAKLAKKRSSIF